MALEIERKFLVITDEWRKGNPRGARFCQGYLAQGTLTAQRATVRVRRAGDRACVTIKGRRRGIERPEFEYLIPVNDAEELLAMCSKPLIEKTRYSVNHGKHCWSVDVFSGVNKGLVLAEIELMNADEAFERPDWLGREVTQEPRYHNSMLNISPIDLHDPAKSVAA
jgi:adenylate cyclase